jgi:hypothetical protein
MDPPEVPFYTIREGVAEQTSFDVIRYPLPEVADDAVSNG